MSDQDRPRAHRGGVGHVRLGPRTRFGATRGDAGDLRKLPDDAVKLWSLEDGRVIARAHGTIIGFSSDEAWLFVEGPRGALTLVETATGRVRSFADIGRYALRGEALDGGKRIRLWKLWGTIDYDPETGAELSRVNGPNRRDAQGTLDDGSIPLETALGALVARGYSYCRNSPEPVRLCRASDESVVLELSQGTGDVSADGRWLLYGDYTGAVVLWHLERREPVLALSDPAAFPEHGLEAALADRRARRTRALPEAVAKGPPVERLIAVRETLRDALRAEPGGMTPIELPLRHLSILPGFVLHGRRSGRQGWASKGKVLAFATGTDPTVLAGWLAQEDPLYAGLSGAKSPPAPPGTRPATSVFQGDGSLESYLEAAFLYNELDNFGESGHGATWSAHRLLDRCEPLVAKELHDSTVEDVREVFRERGLEPTEPAFGAVVELELGARQCSESSRRCRLEPGVRPEDWEPSLEREPSGDVVVAFATVSEYGRVAHTRTTFRFPGGAYDQAERRVKQLAEGGPGYVV